MKSSPLTAFWAAAFFIPSVAAINPLHGATVYGVAVDGGAQTLLSWDSATPGNILTSTAIAGLPAGETIRGIDFDPIYFVPSEARLFAITAGSGPFASLYVIDRPTGTATLQDPLSLPQADASGVYYGVTSFGSGRLRSVSDSGHVTGYNASFLSLERGSGSPIGTVSGRHLVRLVDGFAVDTAADTLVHFDNLNSPGSGITTIGSLGADFEDPGGIDIDDATGNSYAAMLRHGESLSTFCAVCRLEQLR
jgi:hypothetical protein